MRKLRKSLSLLLMISMFLATNCIAATETTEYSVEFDDFDVINNLTSDNGIAETQKVAITSPAAGSLLAYGEPIVLTASAEANTQVTFMADGTEIDTVTTDANGVCSCTWTPAIYDDIALTAETADETSAPVTVKVMQATKDSYTFTGGTAVDSWADGNGITKTGVQLVASGGNLNNSSLGFTSGVKEFTLDVCTDENGNGTSISPLVYSETVTSGTGSWLTGMVKMNAGTVSYCYSTVTTTCEPNTWYNIRLVINMDHFTYSAYINGIQTVHDVDFSQPTDPITKMYRIKIENTNSAAVYYTAPYLTTLTYGVAVTSPANGTILEKNQPVMLTASTAEFNDTTADTLSFYQNGIKLGDAEKLTDGTFVYSWTPTFSGSAEIYAVAEIGGKNYVSEEITVKVLGDTVNTWSTKSVEPNGCTVTNENDATAITETTSGLDSSVPVTLTYDGSAAPFTQITATSTKSGFIVTECDVTLASSSANLYFYNRNTGTNYAQGGISLSNGTVKYYNGTVTVDSGITYEIGVPVHVKTLWNLDQKRVDIYINNVRLPNRSVMRDEWTDILYLRFASNSKGQTITLQNETVRYIPEEPDIIESDIYNIDIENHSFFVYPYTSAATLKSNITAREGYSLVLKDAEESEVENGAAVTDDMNLCIINAQSGKTEEVYSISVYGKAVEEGFENWDTSIKLCTGQTTSYNGWSLSMPSLDSSVEAKDVAYMQPVDIPDHGGALHIYSNSNYSADNSWTQMNLIRSSCPDKSLIGSKFVVRMSAMMPNSDSEIHSLISYNAKDGTAQTLKKIIQFSDGNVLFLGMVVGNYNIGEWTDVYALCDADTGTLSVYINGICSYSGQNASVAAFDYLTNVRAAQQQFVQDKVVESYIDNFEIFGIGEISDLLLSTIDISLQSQVYSICGSSVNGYYGLTVKQLKEGAQIYSGATLKVFEADGVTEADDNTPAEKGMKMVVYSADSQNQAVYTLDVKYYEAGEVKLLVNGLSGYEKFTNGTLSAEIDITNYTQKTLPASVVLAQYDSTDKTLIQISIESENIQNGETKLSATLDVTNCEGTFVKAMAWSGMENLVPLADKAEMEAFSLDKLENVQLMYPGHVEKALTFSYDDLIEGGDERLIQIFDDAGIKATFNLITNRFINKSESEREAIKNVYSGHEISNHSYTHPRMYLTEETDVDGTTYSPLSYEEVVNNIQKGIDDIVTLTGEKPIGFAWPYQAPVARSDYSKILEYMKNAGIKYVRPVTVTGGFDLPADWYDWKPTCHHDNMSIYLQKYLDLETNGELKLMYVWGHTYEFDPNYLPANTKLRWDGITALAEIIKERDDIWKATNGEIYNYVEALKLVEADYEANTITNNSALDIYAVINGVKMIIPKNSVFTMK